MGEGAGSSRQGQRCVENEGSDGERMMRRRGRKSSAAGGGARDRGMDSKEAAFPEDTREAAPTF